MSDGDISNAADALSGAFQVAGARELGTIIEALPEFARILHAGLVNLDGEVTERAGPALERTGEVIAEMAQAAYALMEAAQEAASLWQEESSFWLTGE